MEWYGVDAKQYYFFQGIKNSKRQRGQQWITHGRNQPMIQWESSCASTEEWDWSLRRDFYLPSKLIYGHISIQFDWMTWHGQTWQNGSKQAASCIKVLKGTFIWRLEKSFWITYYFVCALWFCCPHNMICELRPRFHYYYITRHLDSLKYTESCVYKNSKLSMGNG